MKTKKVIIFALIFGLLSAGSIYWYVLELEKQHSLPLGKVLVAKTEIPANSQIDPQMFEWQHIPEDYIHPRAVKEEDLVNGTITKTTLVQGEQLIVDKLVTGESSEDGLSYSIEPGYRAVSIAITRVSAVSHLIRPGDNIDVVVTLPLNLSEDEEAENEIVTTYVLQNLKVLAVGPKLVPSAEEAESEASTLTLAIDPVEAPRLILADERGSIRLLLRSPIDDTILDVPPAEMKDILTGSKAVKQDTLSSSIDNNDEEGEINVQN